ncbi:MAG: sodium:solute symporter, partial [Clostridia bacterium]|nr:sodium:solute symporter [Clostridia bacterium]
ATAINDFIQGIIMLGGIIAVIASVLHANGGLSTALETLATGENGGWEYASFFGADPVFLLFVVLLTSLGTWGLPQMVGKFYAIKDEDAIKKGTIISTVFAVIVAGGCYFLGGFGRLYDVGDSVAKGDFDAIIPTMLKTLPDIIIAIVIVLVLSASMSTLSSLVLTSSSTVTLDFIAPLCEKKKPLNDKKQMLIIRAFIVVFIVISAVIAIMQYKNKNMLIAQMMGVSWGALAGAFLAPFLYGRYWKKTTKAGVVASFVFGVGLELVQLLISMNVLSVADIPVLSFVFRNSLFSGVFAMVGGLILVPVVSQLTQKSAPKNTDEIFSCYERKALVTVTDSLGEEKKD